MDENKEKVEIDKDVFEKLEKLPSVVEGLVEELKTERKAKQDAEAARDAAIAAAAAPKEDPATPPDPKDPTKVFEELMAKKEQESAQTARQNAESKFKSAHKEFHPDNDPGGIKFAAFQRYLARINTTGLKTEEEFTSAYTDALALMNRTEAPKETVITPYADTPTDGGEPRQSDPNALTPKEKKVIEGLGWSEEKYLKMKKSRPAYVEQLLAYAK